MADKEASTTVAADASRNLAGLKLPFKDAFVVGGGILQTSSSRGSGAAPQFENDT